MTPAQCTQFDLDSLSELLELLQAVRDINPRLRLFALQTFASTNAQNKERERVDFLGYLEALEDLPALDSLIRYRRPYRDCISGGMSAAELEPNSAAAAEVEALADEINRIVMGETLEASA